MKSNFFGRIEFNEHAFELLKLANDGVTLEQWATAVQRMSTGVADFPVCQKILDEAKEFRIKKSDQARLAGLKSAESRRKKATGVNGRLTDVNETQPSNRSSNSNSNRSNSITKSSTLGNVEIGDSFGKQVIDYLNIKASKNFKPNSEKTKKLINARKKENFTLDDFKIVIDKKVLEWKGDHKFDQYLRPETLFSTKFESYLNQNIIDSGTGISGRATNRQRIDEKLERVFK